MTRRSCPSATAGLVPVEDQAQLTTAFLQEVDRRYQPERVLLEYNGMWPIQILRDLKLPKTWGLYQAIDVIDGTTFEMYRTNMQSMIVDMVTEADMVLFNRCTPDMPLSGWKRSIRAVNRMCEIVFEDEKGEELEVEDILPYSLDSTTIDLEDDDYGIWYLDIQDHPERYVGKTITFKAQAMTSMKLPKAPFPPPTPRPPVLPHPLFFGFLCKYDRSPSLGRGGGHRHRSDPLGARRRLRGRGRGALCPNRGKGRASQRSPGLFPLIFHPPVRHSALPGDFSACSHLKVDTTLRHAL